MFTIGLNAASGRWILSRQHFVRINKLIINKPTLIHSNVSEFNYIGKAILPKTDIIVQFRRQKVRKDMF